MTIIQVQVHHQIELNKPIKYFKKHGWLDLFKTVL